MSTTTLPSIQTGIVPASRWPWVMLFSRLGLFFIVQAMVAAAFYLAGSSSAWESSTAWWPISVGIANLICIYLLIQLYKGEGKSYWNLFRIEKATWKSDLLVLLGFMIIAGPVAMFPNTLLSRRFLVRRRRAT
jgi:hypothetical protein